MLGAGWKVCSGGGRIERVCSGWRLHTGTFHSRMHGVREEDRCVCRFVRGTSR